MTKKRKSKYEKILSYKQKQMDSIKQQIGAQQNIVTKLSQQQIELKNEMNEVESQFRFTADSIAFNQQCGVVMTEVQMKINVVKAEFAAASEKLDHLLHHYQQQDRQMKSWEKLVEQASARIASNELAMELRAADGRFLATQFQGEQR